MAVTPPDTPADGLVAELQAILEATTEHPNVQRVIGAAIAALRQRDDKLRDIFTTEPDLGSLAGCEPPLQEIIYIYYSEHFDADRASDLTSRYIATLKDTPDE
jgi:hypothetical protein